MRLHHYSVLYFVISNNFFVEQLKPPIKVTDCGHSYCEDCLNQVVRGQDSWQCPKSRQIHDRPVSSLPRNFAIEQAVESLSAKPQTDPQSKTNAEDLIESHSEAPEEAQNNDAPEPSISPPDDNGSENVQNSSDVNEWTVEKLQEFLETSTDIVKLQICQDELTRRLETNSNIPICELVETTEPECQPLRSQLEPMHSETAATNQLVAKWTNTELREKMATSNDPNMTQACQNEFSRRMAFSSKSPSNQSVEKSKQQKFFRLDQLYPIRCSPKSFFHYEGQILMRQIRLAPKKEPVLLTIGKYRCTKVALKTLPLVKTLLSRAYFTPSSEFSSLRILCNISKRIRRCLEEIWRSNISYIK